MKRQRQRYEKQGRGWTGIGKKSELSAEDQYMTDFPNKSGEGRSEIGKGTNLRDGLEGGGASGKTCQGVR